MAFKGVVIEVSREDRDWFHQWKRELSSQRRVHVTSIDAFKELRKLAEKAEAAR